VVWEDGAPFTGHPSYPIQQLRQYRCGVAGDALIQEWYNGREALIKDGVTGATRFKDGLGRHGDFTTIR